MEKRMQELQEILERVEGELYKLPEGSLVYSRDRDGYLRYFHSIKGKRVYLTQEQEGLKRQLAQKSYLLQVRKAARQELTWALSEARRKNKSFVPAEEVYDCLSPERQALVESVVPSPKQYVTSWLQKEGKGLGFRPEEPSFFTSSGERVRSKSEVIMLERTRERKVPYRYEYPLVLLEQCTYPSGHTYEKQVTIHPDLTILLPKSRRLVYWEHFGKMDDPAYAGKALKKMELYRDNGLAASGQFCFTFETQATPLSSKQVDRVLDELIEMDQ